MSNGDLISTCVKIGSSRVGLGEEAYIIAELSGNHLGKLDNAIELLRAAKNARANAAKLQTYTADSMTIDSDADIFKLPETSLWKGYTYYQLYKEAATPAEWLPKLKKEAVRLGIDLISSPFDNEAVRILDELDFPALKIASFEVVDLKLIQSAASTGRPVIISTGMATLAEVDAAVNAARSVGDGGIILLYASSAYPAPTSDMALRTIPHMIKTWNLPVGLSDHTQGIHAAVAAVALGANVIEKHLTLRRSDGGPDAEFSMEPDEFKKLVSSVREVESTLTRVRYGPSPGEIVSLNFRRSLFVVKDMEAGEKFSEQNVRSIRPGYGLPPKEWNQIEGRVARGAIKRGTPLQWDLVGDIG